VLDLVDRGGRDEQPRFLLEASALKMTRLADLTPIEDLIRRLEGGSAPPAADPAHRSTPRRAGGPGAGPRGREATGRAGLAPPAPAGGPLDDAAPSPTDRDV